MHYSNLRQCKLPRRFRLNQVEAIGTQVGSIKCNSYGFLTRVPAGGELIVKRYHVTDSGLRFDKTLKLPIPRRHWCHIAPKRRCFGSIGTLVRYWDQGTYRTPDDENDEYVLVLTRLHFYFN